MEEVFFVCDMNRRLRHIRFPEALLPFLKQGDTKRAEHSRYFGIEARVQFLITLQLTFVLSVLEVKIFKMEFYFLFLCTVAVIVCIYV